MSKYIIVEGFENLISILDNERDYDSRYRSKYASDIDTLQGCLNYDSEELNSGDYETECLKVKVIEKYLNKNTSIMMYECETK